MTADPDTDVSASSGSEVTEAEPDGLSTQPAPVRPWHGGALALARNSWRRLTSMRTALVLLFLLALASVPGSLLPQRPLNPTKVNQYIADHPGWSRILDAAGFFDVFAAPWFAAIYLLLFVSLVGCLVPRIRLHARALRRPPPKAPRHLLRMSTSTGWASAADPHEVLRAAEQQLRRKRWRTTTTSEPDGSLALAAEKGYLRETGNLVFHVSLVVLLVGIALGGLFGYKADKLLVEGSGFHDTTAALDEFHPGRLVSGSDLAPFGINLQSFSASYLASGQPSAFAAHITYTASPGAPAEPFDLQVNHPLSVDSAKVYLIGHGYAPVFRVTDARGQVVYDDPTPFIPANTGTFLSDGVVKVPDAAPSQLGFMGVFVPTPVLVDGTLVSAYPAATDPAVSLIAYAGNLGMNSALSQSVYQMDTSDMRQLTAAPHVLLTGQTWSLPGGNGKITFLGYKQWVSLAITYDPGQVPALICGILALAGLLLSFLVRRRRVFVRAVPATSGTGSVVSVGGLTRTDASGGFEDEFAELSAELAATDAAREREPNNQSETGA